MTGQRFEASSGYYPFPLYVCRAKRQYPINVAGILRLFQTNETIDFPCYSKMQCNGKYEIFFLLMGW